MEKIYNLGFAIYPMFEMDIPNIVIVLLQVFGVISLTLFIISFAFILQNKVLSNSDKVLWLLGTALLPILGPVLFLTLGREGK